jgi:hypothetical protein
MTTPNPPGLAVLSEQIDTVMVREQQRLRSHWREVERQRDPMRRQALLDRLTTELTTATDRVARRAALVPTITYPAELPITARRDDLLRTIGDRLRGLSVITELVVPFDRGDVLASLHREGEVLVETATEEGMRVRARLDDASVSRLREFVVAGSPGPV